MRQNNALKKDEGAGERYKKERLSSDSFKLGRNLSDAGEEGEEGEEGGEGRFNPQEEANRLYEDREREREKMGGGGEGKEGEEGKDGQDGEEGGEGEAEKEKEKITIPKEVSAFVLQWEFIFALAGPFFLFILVVEFIALRIFSMFKFSKLKKICTLGNLLLSCFTTLIYFLFIMMLVAALQKTGGTKTGAAWFGIKAIASSTWSGITSFFGFGK